MTERFQIKPSTIVDDVTVIIDNKQEYTFPILDKNINYMFCKALNELNDENQQIKTTIREAYNTERTQIGQSVLKQLMERIE